MYRNDFYAFFTERKEKILQRIEVAMGKVIPRDQEVLEEGSFISVEFEMEDTLPE